MVKQICVCAQKKAFLQELCMVTVGQLISEGHFSDDVIRDHVIPLVGVTSGWEECTPERLYIILLLSKQFGKVRTLDLYSTFPLIFVFSGKMVQGDFDDQMEH